MSFCRLNIIINQINKLGKGHTNLIITNLIRIIKYMEKKYLSQK